MIWLIHQWLVIWLKHAASAWHLNNFLTTLKYEFKNCSLLAESDVRASKKSAWSLSCIFAQFAKVWNFNYNLFFSLLTPCSPTPSLNTFPHSSRGIHMPVGIWEDLTTEKLKEHLVWISGVISMRFIVTPCIVQLQLTVPG